MAVVPFGLVILRDQSIFMTVRDWTSPGQGIDRFEDAYATVSEQEAFRFAVEEKTGVKLDDIIGNLVVSQDTQDSSTVPVRPGVCAFRMNKNEPQHFVARNFRELGVAKGQEYSVLAITADTGDLLGSYPAAYAAADESSPTDVITYKDLGNATLVPVYSSLTITKPALEEIDGGSAAGYGDGAL